jgi:hypothetical protein
MRWAVLFLCGCDLYFGPSSYDDEPPRHDAGQPSDSTLPLPTCTTWFHCRDGVIYQSDPAVPTNGTCPETSWNIPTVIETCPNGCAFENDYQATAVTPCLQPPPPAFTCDSGGACSAGQTKTCSANLQCGAFVTIGSCSCSSGQWSCQPSCNSNLCSPGAVQAALRGTWTGTSSSQWATYNLTLTIDGNGYWSGDAAPYLPFYYGDNGAGPGSRIIVQAQTDIGAYGSVGLFGGTVTGYLTQIVVQPNRLTFTLVDSWLSCTRTFRYDLRR